jgi:putative membrane protein
MVTVVRMKYLLAPLLRLKSKFPASSAKTKQSAILAPPYGPRASRVLDVIIYPMAREPDERIEPDELLPKAVDATRRTRLANERTQLAWWRTGLTALAVALGVGRVVPELDSTATRWPYVVAGVGFAIWGIFAMAYGTMHSSAIEDALSRGRFLDSARWPLAVLTGAGVALGLLTALLILLD